MDNLLINCIEFISDTYGNRPKNADGTTRAYTNDERRTLKDTVRHHMDDVEARKNEIPQETFELLLMIYELVRIQLISGQI